MSDRVKFRQGNIAYRMDGEGRCIVLLHGFLESSEIWDAYITLLSKQYRVVAIDLPGHGGSDCFGYVHDMEMMARSVKGVLDSLGLRRYVILGHSMGGYVALAFAELFPDNLRGLGLVHSTAAADSESKQSERDKAIEAVKSNKEVYVRAAIQKLFNPPHLKIYSKEIEQLHRIATACERRAMIACIEGMKRRKNREMLLQYAHYPILFIAGEHDSLISLTQIKNQVSLASKGVLCLLHQSAHMGFIEEKKKTLRAIRSFIRICHATSFPDEFA